MGHTRPPRGCPAPAPTRPRVPRIQGLAVIPPRPACGTLPSPGVAVGSVGGSTAPGLLASLSSPFFLRNGGPETAKRGPRLKSGAALPLPGTVSRETDFWADPGARSTGQLSLPSGKEGPRAARGRGGSPGPSPSPTRPPPACVWGHTLTGQKDNRNVGWGSTFPHLHLAEPSSPGGGGAQVCVQGALSMQEVMQKTLI